MNRNDYICSKANKPASTWENNEVVLFHLMNPNGYGKKATELMELFAANEGLDDDGGVFDWHLELLKLSLMKRVDGKRLAKFVKQGELIAVIHAKLIGEATPDPLEEMKRRIRKATPEWNSILGGDE
ncbi:MAG: hypothetical protein ABJN62_11330 [Halioglobus sp.]